MLIMECFFWFVTTILINMPKIIDGNSSQNKKNEAILHKNSDLLQISKDILRSKRPTQQSRMKTTFLKFALIITLTINLSAKSVKAEITMNEPTKFIQELFPQIDRPIEAKIIFQQNQLMNYNLKRETSGQDKRRALQIFARIAPISSKSLISATIPANIKLQLNHKGVLSCINKRNQELKLRITKLTITKCNIIITQIITDFTTLYYLMQAITLLIIMYTSLTMIQELIKHYSSKQSQCTQRILLSLYNLPLI